MYVGVLHKHGANIMRSDTPNGSKPLHRQVGAFKLLQICLIRRGPVTIDLFCLLIFIPSCYGETAVQS